MKPRNSKRAHKGTKFVRDHAGKKKVNKRHSRAFRAIQSTYRIPSRPGKELDKIWDRFEFEIKSVDMFLFFEKKEGSWVSVADDSLVDKMQVETLWYWGRRKNKKGEWEPEKRNVETHASRKKKKKALEGEGSEPEIEEDGAESAEPSAIEKFEVQFAPHQMFYCHLVMEKIRDQVSWEKLAAGASELDAALAADKAADDWAIDFIRRSIPIGEEYLEWRTGRRVFSAIVHTNSGKWHPIFWTTYVGADHKIQGLIQAGRGGKVIIGYESWIDAGVDLEELNSAYQIHYKQKLAIERRRAKRYADGRFVDVGLSKAMAKFFRAEVEARGEQDLFEQACAKYRDALVEAEPLKQALEAEKKAKEEAWWRSKMTESAAARRNRINGAVPYLKSALNEVLVVGDDDSQMITLTKKYKLVKIAGLVDDMWVTIDQLKAWARESLARLLRELARLFGGAEELELKSEEPAQEHAPEVVTSGVAVVTPTIEPEPSPEAPVEAPAMTPPAFEPEPVVLEANGPTLEEYRAKGVRYEELFAAFPHLATPLLRRLPANLALGLPALTDFTEDEVAQFKLDRDALIAGQAVPISAVEPEPVAASVARQEPENEAPVIPWDGSPDQAALTKKAEADARWDWERKLTKLGEANFGYFPEADLQRMVGLLMSGELTWKKVEVNAGHYQPDQLLGALTAPRRKAEEPEVRR